ncbi:MAG: hypothetical protein COT89_02715 [Candidatus Colwellbacteria bacterium CG10_big_fil_rev_8_21_14_0_10_42_22]|uniref:PDZ domain-containing protein n=1 Tax=Candidatus Colwellbacteria bacterium CG10_big_fil_rev_8_21_14_0_10_42_22 TaxID=1974540 RepID=A0A2H0VHH5_9BACT|nr:MAG: hypothetical protein COT89_02715 [Candidatus Colwellbacteria bacterium CG10_big_fil_rev_8_21_14_0_10_42_22]
MLTFLTILFLALLILGHEFGHFIAAKISGIQVDEFGVGYPPKIFSKKMGKTEYSLNLLPFGGFVRIHGDSDINLKDTKNPERSFHYQPFWKKAFVILSGVLINILIGWIAFSIVLGVGIPGGIFIENVIEGSPADLAGLRAGEIIENYSSTDEFLKYVEDHQGEEIVINDKKITPRINVPEGEGPLGVVVVPSGIEPVPFPNNIGVAFQSAMRMFGLIFVAIGSFLFGILSGNFEALSQFTGPVGVFNIVREAGGLGAIYLIQLLGIISLNLAVLNIIPFPALDGGRLLFISLQKIFGEKILNRKTEVIINVAGFLFLIALMILVTIRDIINL